MQFARRGAAVAYLSGYLIYVPEAAVISGQHHIVVCQHQGGAENNASNRDCYRNLPRLMRSWERASR
jgi:hypothetical protein